jgi:6-phosphogluconolactonase
MANVVIYPGAEELAKAAAERLIRLANDAVETKGVFSVVLAGGSTPLELYRLLASEPYSEQVDWSRAHIFWGDERCVPPDHNDSNYGKARAALIDAVPLPPENVHRIPAELEPERAAEAYEETLLAFFSARHHEPDHNRASFDLVLLGMGDDGHTASIFPGADAVNENRRWVKALYVDKLGAWRITLTPAILNQARQIIFMVSGAVKSYTLQRVIYGSHQPERYPAQSIRPENGHLTWLVDEPAAELF